MKFRAAWLFAVLWLPLSLARADTHSVSYSLWSVTDDLVMLRYTLPRAEARVLVPLNYPAPDAATVGRYVLAHTGVTAGGRDCAAIDQGYDLGLVDTLSLGPGLYGFEILFHCPSTQGLELRNSALFDVQPDHLDLARVQVGGGAFTAQLFTAQHQRLALPPGGAPAPAAASRYVGAGLSHLLHAWDRLCIVLGLLLWVRTMRAGAVAAGALCAGYAASWLLVWAGPWVPRAVPLEAWMGFLVALTAGLIAGSGARRPSLMAAGGAGVLVLIATVGAPLLSQQAITLLLGAAGIAAGAIWMASRPYAGTLAPLMAGLLGFCDGLDLPGDLAVVGLWRGLPASGLVGFDLGALLAACGVLALGLLALRLGQRRWRASGALMRDAVAAVWAGLGCYWMLSRLLG